MNKKIKTNLNRTITLGLGLSLGIFLPAVASTAILAISVIKVGHVFATDISESEIREEFIKQKEEFENETAN